MLLSALLLGTNTLCPCPGHVSGASLSPPVSASMCLRSHVLTCAVAWSSARPVLASQVFGDVGVRGT